ncbi:uncharacterized protein EV422DRAFT_527593 [Fimicolochytrium jonesii]|uniref:uncharacterized protein n=1 Tax=Fimicolochytrium jonesii TaxID=1396493 RepID=UPI0022FDBF6C|nr:uncharacterized protein EV422DRAFT_527593 [Fimicolochytrium jonesii]KAI8821300.1 hypothetical protein EV422DRAFT_527593 [Fimicolochytrium jonesii]
MLSCRRLVHTRGLLPKMPLDTPAAQDSAKAHIHALCVSERTAVLSLGCRYAVLCASLSSANIPTAFAPALDALAEIAVDEKERAVCLRKGREAVYKSYTVAGMPKTINGLSELRSGAIARWPSSAATFDEPLPEDQTGSTEQQRAERGQVLFNEVYGRTAQRLTDILGSLHPRLLSVIVTDAYGKILADTGVLGLEETELVMVGALKVQGGPVAKQVESHRRGAVRMGASQSHVEAAEYIADEVVRLKEMA